MPTESHSQFFEKAPDLPREGWFFKVEEERFRVHAYIAGATGRAFNLVANDRLTQSTDDYLKEAYDSGAADAAAMVAAAMTHDRGILIIGGTAGIGKHRPYYTLDAVLAITALRRSGCKLPIELWHDHDPALLSEAVSPALSREGGSVFIRDIWELPGGAEASGWQFVPLAMVHSNFREVLYIDADNIVVEDPTALFATTAYRKAGAIFWPDHDWLYGKNPMWHVIKREPVKVPGTDNCQAMMNRTRHWLPILLANDFSKRGPQVYFRFLHGDKELWRFAWMALRRPFHLVQDVPDVAGYHADKNTFCGHSLLHHHPQQSNHIAFVHRAMYKFSHPPVEDNLLWTAVKDWKSSTPGSRHKKYEPCICGGHTPCMDLDSAVDTSAKTQELLGTLSLIERDLLYMRTLCTGNTSGLRSHWWLWWVWGMRRLLCKPTLTEGQRHRRTAGLCQR